MEEIPELPTSKLVNCWAAANHGLAVEVEKRAVREALLDCANTTEVPWFSKDFGQWLGNILHSKQMTGQLCADFLLEQKPPHCFLTAWRHLYDTAKLGVMNGIINDLDHTQLRNWKSLAENVPMLWPGLITEWNLRLSHLGKGAANNRSCLESRFLVNFSQKDDHKSEPVPGEPVADADFIAYEQGFEAVEPGVGVFDHDAAAVKLGVK